MISLQLLITQGYRHPGICLYLFICLYIHNDSAKSIVKEASLKPPSLQKKICWRFQHIFSFEGFLKTLWGGSKLPNKNICLKMLEMLILNRLKRYFDKNKTHVWGCQPNILKIDVSFKMSCSWGLSTLWNDGNKNK